MIAAALDAMIRPIAQDTCSSDAASKAASIVFWNAVRGDARTAKSSVSGVDDRGDGLADKVSSAISRSN